MKVMFVGLIFWLQFIALESNALSNSKIHGGIINICEEELIDEKISNDGATIARFVQTLCSDMFFTHLKSSVIIKKNYETNFYEVYSFFDFIRGDYTLKMEFKNNNTLAITSYDKIGIGIRKKKFKDIDINVYFYPDNPEERRFNLIKRKEDPRNWWMYNIEP